ncbi:LuxR C-terminal-related transcriptional regulator [Streptomyces sp. NPDC058045]|uniref:helix-turn-helix transcriptional regulator n=1 Tax=Streptomyces sp. NPDC058045 TaxID=3346311 RepID=UPI0036F0DE74
MSEPSRLAIYLELLARGEVESANLASELNLSPQEAEHACSSLENLGLIGRTQRESEQIVPASPEAALLRILRRQRNFVEHHVQEIRHLEEAVRVLADVYIPAAAAQRSEIQISTASGRNELLQALNDLSETAQGVVSSMHTGPTPSLFELHRSLGRDLDLVERGITVRRLHLQRHAAAPDSATYLEALADSGVALRLAPVLPMHMFIADTSLALLPLTPEAPDEGMVVLRGTQLVRSFMTLFEYIWHSATPYTVGTPDKDRVSLSPEQIAIVRMLAESVKDEKIARDLGVSLRTLSRQIAELMQRLGVSSRFAAGVRAAQLGLLDPVPSDLDQRSAC